MLKHIQNKGFSLFSSTGTPHRKQQQIKILFGHAKYEFLYWNDTIFNDTIDFT